MWELGNISSDTVRAYLQRLKPNKSEGPDGIYARILNECESEVADSIGQYLFEITERGKNTTRLEKSTYSSTIQRRR